jgi:hypothetical protein
MIFGEAHADMLGAVGRGADENLASAPIDRIKRHIVQHKHFFIRHLKTPFKTSEHTRPL